VVAICNSQNATTKRLTSAINTAFAALPTKENVMKNMVKSFIGFLVALAASSAVAQNAIQVKVPFVFSAAEQTLPAGDYRVTLDRAVDRVTLRGENTGAILFVTPAVDLNNRRSFLRLPAFRQRLGPHYSRFLWEHAGTIHG
jgi:hypothetical protein